MPAHKIPISERLEAGSSLLGECRLWQRAKTKGGYGIIAIGRKNRLAHRVAYETAKGEIPHGLMLDHLCRNRACINADHLEPVTALENQRRGFNCTKTHCVNGHEFTDANTYRIANERRCRACARERQRKTKQRKQNIQFRDNVREMA